MSSGSRIHTSWCPWPKRILSLPLVLLAGLCATPLASAAGPTPIVDLGPAASTQWVAVNDAGQVAGATGTDARATTRAARFANGVATALDAAGTGAQAISNDGTVFGVASNEDGSGSPRIWRPDGTSQTLGAYATNRSLFRSASPAGVGLFNADSTGKLGVTRPPYLDATVPVTSTSGATGVNDAGHVVSGSEFYDGSTILTMPLVAEGAQALNAHDQVVGRLPADQGSKPAVVQMPGGVLTPIPDAPNARSFTSPTAINDDGTVIGNSDNGAWTWSPGAPPQLLDDRLAPGSGWHLQAVTSLSDTGYIVGLGTLNGVAHYFLLVGEGTTGISGTVRHPDATVAPGVTMTLTGTEDGGAAVSQTTVSGATGAYAFKAPFGTYTVRASGEATDENGGALTAATCPGTKAQDTCQLGHVASGSVADFTYTACAAATRHPNGKPPTGCPVIFIPGFLGTKIACPRGGRQQELWPNIPSPLFGLLYMQADGFTNVTDNGPCNAAAAAVPGRPGLVSAAGGVDAYGAGLAFLDRIAPNRVSVFAYDWRRSPAAAVPALGALVDQLKADSGAARVVIVAHSMGGLVTRAYINDAGRADNVSRIVTEGTPYWGAPKSHFALLQGNTETPAGGPLDYVVTADQLQHAARTMLGLFTLYPSDKADPWLKVQSLNHRVLNAAGIDRWISRLGGSAALADRARSFHDGIDNFVDHDIDYEVVVGTGVPTVGYVTIDDQAPAATASLGYVSGDGTVPLKNASQATTPGTVAVGGASIHPVCRVDHMSLTGNPGVQAMIEPFVLKGTPIPLSAGQSCAPTGEQIQLFNVHPSTQGNPRAAQRGIGSALSLEQARSAGLADVFTFGGQDTIVTDASHPVTLSLSGRGIGVEVRSITGSTLGRVRQYRPVTGTITVSPDGTVAKGGRTLKRRRADTKAPRTRVRVRRKGKRFVVRLTAKDGTAVAATYTRLGTAAAVRYRKPLTVTLRQLRRLEFSSVDIYGNRERAHRPSAPR